MNEYTFIGRTNEIQQLEDVWARKQASLVVIKGRRRIGKSRLIEEFARCKPFYRFMGLAPDPSITAQDQRNAFARQLAEQTDLPYVQTDDWASLFSLLAKHTKNGHCIILLDEITWMAQGDPTFLSKLQQAWELSFKQAPQLVFILCGSVSAWIEKNILSSTGYFGRVSKKITLHELPLRHCNTLLEGVGFKRSAMEKFTLLSLTGGIPWYLELIQPKYSATENIRQLCFHADGILVDEHHHIFHDLFGKRNAIYEKITRFLSTGSAVYSAIATGIKYSSSGALSEYLNELIESGYVSKDFSWSIPSTKVGKIAKYRLSDNYLRFFYKYISPKIELIKQNQWTPENLITLPQWNSIMGLQFENLVLSNRNLIQKALELNNSEIVISNPYLQQQTSTEEGCQIDYLIQTQLNALFVCEIKFSKKPIGMSVVDEMQEKIRRLKAPKQYRCVPVLIHISGITDALEDSGYFYKMIDFSDFLEQD